MTGYQKKVAYLDYLENGMKIKNAGFVKAEENNGQMRLEMRVKNVPEVFNGEYELNADAGGTIGRISLSRGNGGCCVVWQSGSKVPEGKQKVKANGIYIRLPGRHLLQAVWNEPMEILVDETEEEPNGAGGLQEERNIPEHTPAEERQAPPVMMPVPAAEVIPVGQRLEEEPEIDTISETVQPENRQPFERTEEKQVPEENEMPVYPAWEMAFEPHMQISSEACEKEEEPQELQERNGEESVYYGDKWEQLSHMYPLIHPFQDDRTYLSISPKDFVVLRQEYQKMVHNSFLLHGYYNYKHLILGKVKEKEGSCFYLGVPGNFYDREKMVAEMFGFEAFEGEKNPAEPGDFGYFMKKVEI